MIKKLAKISAAASSLVVGATTAVSSVLAQAPVVREGLTGGQTTLGEVGTALGTGVGTIQLPVLIGNIINVVLGTLGILLVAYTIYGGFLWMTSQGDPKKIDTAKGIIKSAIIGIVVIVAAYAISAFVIQAVITATT